MIQRNTLKLLIHLWASTLGVILIYKPDSDDPPVRIYSRPIPKTVTNAPLLLIESSDTTKTPDPLTDANEAPVEQELKTKNLLPTKKPAAAKAD